MADTYNMIYKGGSAEIVEKKSRFIADVAPVNSEEEFAAFLEGVRKKYWDLRHHCFAYVIGEGGGITRCSDDGEPSGTAGRPILDAIVNAGLRNCCVVVSRYFGGVLLGTGGLSRAYGLSAKEGIAACKIAKVFAGYELKVCCDYSLMGKIQYIAASAGIKSTGTEYSDKVILKYVVEEDRVCEIISKMTEATSAQSVIEKSEAIRFALFEDDVIIL